MEEFIASLLYSFGAIFIILDPLLSVPIFAEMTKGRTEEEINHQAFIAVAVAGVLMYIFLFFNFLIFDTLQITIASFEVAGGVLLFILGMQESLGIHIHPEDRSQANAAGVVIGTPLLCGPGTITTVLILSSQFGVLIPALAIALSLVATWVILRLSSLILRVVGDIVIGVLARMLGMLLAAIAVTLIARGILSLV